MSAIGPGDWVECVDPKGADWLTFGAIYLVDDVRKFHGACGHCGRKGADCDNTGLLLGGIRGIRPGCADYNCSRCFRPIYRPRAELIETLLRKADEPLRVEA
jgi:hypothetical protein